MAEPASLSDAVYARLRLALISGGHAPGDRLNIRGIAAASGLSPTPVREAVMQLVREGALELRPGHQPRVPVLTPEQYLRICQVRAPLERLATALATAHLTAEMLDELAVLDGHFVAAEREGDWTRAMAANQAFHFLIYRASGNPVLAGTIGNLWLLTGPLVGRQYESLARLASETALHGQIIDALRRRMPDEAGDLVVQDMRQGAAVIVARMREGRARRR